MIYFYIYTQKIDHIIVYFIVAPIHYFNNMDLFVLRITALYPWFCTPIAPKLSRQKSTIITLDPNTGVPTQSDHNKNNKCQFIKSGFDVLYFISMMVLISWELIHAVINISRNQDARYITSRLHVLLIVCQLILGRIYFRKNHFFVLIRQNSDFVVIRWKLFLFLGFIALGVATIHVVLMALNSYELYDDIFQYKNYRIPFLILTFTSKFFDNIVFIFTCVAFLMVFEIHQKKITQFKNQFIDGVYDPEKTDKQQLILDYTSIKEEHSESVNRFNDMFSSINIIGALNALFIIINRNTIYVIPIDYIDLGVLIIVITVYFYSVVNLYASIDEIKKIANSRDVLNHFMQRYDTVVENDDISKTDNINVGTGIRVAELSKVADWLVMDRLFTNGWQKFNILGLEIEDTAFIKKGISMGVSIVLGLQVVKSFGFAP